MGLFDRLRGGDDERVVFLGIDGVPYDLVQDHPDVFENLTDIAETGSAGRLESIVPPESSACWPSLTTGKNPGETGVYGFQDREVDSYETYVPMGKHVSATRLWDRVTDDGRDATVLNVPVTFPPSSRIQRQVSGFLSPSLDAAASDDAVRQVLEDHDYKIDVNAKLGHDDDKTEFVENAHATLDARYDVFTHYLAEDDWDLFFGVFMSTDRVNHFLFGDYENDGEYAEEFLDFYRTLDEYVGEIRDRLDDDTTLVVASDHGFTELEWEVNCNQFLADEGWLSYEDDDHDSLTDIDDETRAYSLIPGRFYLNLEGREPDGVVPESEYEAVRDELVDDLESLTGPDGRRVCKRIVRGETVFDGDNDEIAPDLVVIPADGFDLKSGFSGKEAVFTEGPRNGMHKFENSLLYSTDADLDVEGSNLFDVTPTILDLMDVEADADFDGESLLDT
ncbi:type I phosphodiesterase/nucleotide pyrophosphatase [Halorubrum saccharovorum DSM 1137]|uniref:Type I phosphodiesterase/nucleotide pyrophosphatase n=1 Tax=Halorubrum saccharovorum DSM 1137 TaxID=1227484 RepID=M0DN08_9EURY|nr:alkaline phosphatase family protein [Halorubrum saccharovorum]ELZ36208.1 type I phosphodiesterase/nucleotide pyrophosphatase [Halorubrum saccharovorum DSM 1137]